MFKLNFLQFPKEIRDIIYSFLYINPYKYTDNDKISGLSSQLFIINPQIYNKASKVLYGKQPIR